MNSIDLEIDNIYVMFLLVLLSLLISTINPRYSCSAYSGGLLCIAEISVSYINGIRISTDIAIIMFIVASLHFSEGLLLFAFGKKYSYKIIKKTRGGLLLGYIMKAIWIVPIIIKGMSLPIICILGYQIECFTTSRKEKKLEISLMLFLYSTILICIAFVSIGSNFFKLGGAIYMLLGHEGMHYFERYSDKKVLKKRIRINR
jgi:hypothetical protein